MVAVQISYFGEADTVQVGWKTPSSKETSDKAQVAGDFSDGGGASWQPEDLANKGAGEIPRQLKFVDVFEINFHVRSLFCNYIYSSPGTVIPAMVQRLFHAINTQRSLKFG